MGPNKKIVSVLVVLVQILSASCRVPSARKAEVELEGEFEKAFALLRNAYRKCGQTEDTFSCMKIKAVRFADRAIKIGTIPIFDGVTVVKTDESTSRSFSVLPDFNENELPRDPEKKQEALNEFIAERVTRFLKTHSIQLDLPKFIGETDENDVGEGRGKLKKMMGPLIMAAMMKGSMMAYALKAVGLLAAKALMVSKIALVLAGIIGLKKLFSGGQSESKTIEIVQKPQVSHYSSGHDFGGGYGGGGGSSGGWESSGHGGYGRSLEGTARFEPGAGEDVPAGMDNAVRRSLDPFPQAHELAYRSRIPQQQQQQQQQP